MSKKITNNQSRITRFRVDDNSSFVIRHSSLARRGFTLIELAISVTLFIIAISTALFAVLGTNGLIQKADARSAISENTQAINDAIRQAVGNAAIGTVLVFHDGSFGPSIGVQIKSFSTLQSGNTCTYIGLATATTDASGEEIYTASKVGDVMALKIYNLDSAGNCPGLTDTPIYQNRLTSSQAKVKSFGISIQNITCNTPSPTCVNKQLLRYSLTLEMAQKGSGGTNEARKPTLTVQEGVPIGLINEAINPLKIETASLPNANASSAYSASLVASGGVPPYSWALDSGALPAGLTLHSDSGVIDGTPNPPTAGNTYNFTVKVTDSAVPVASSIVKAFSIGVANNLIVITSTSPLRDAKEGDNYTPAVQLTATIGSSACGSCTWTIDSSGNNLPTGMSMNASGKIDGTPNLGTAGDYSLVIRASEGGNPSNFATKTFSLKVTTGGGGPSI